MAGKVEEAIASMVKNLEAKTGKSLAAWIDLARSAGDLKHGQLIKVLKEQHGLTHGYANFVAHQARLEPSKSPPAGEDLVAAQYAGDKADLKAIYDKLLKAVAKFGTDVEVSPKKTYVSLRRAKQFALVQPTTKTRLDVGINLKGIPAKGRLEAAGSFNAMVTHRVRIESAADLNKELIGWLKQAYDAAA